MQSEDEKEIYAKKMPSVEPTFGHVKHNQKNNTIKSPRNTTGANTSRINSNWSTNQ